jgi:RNA polymerase sigma-70 factor (ECF subfamily)
VSVDVIHRVSETDETALTDEALVLRIQQGETDALGELFLRHAQGVRRLLMSMMGSTLELDDLTQEVFLCVHRSISSFRGAARFSTWLHRVAVNTALSALRRPKRLMSVLPEELETHADTHDMESMVLGRETARRLYAVLGTMSDKRRIAWVLFEIEGKSIEETARLTDTSIPVVKSRIFFARKEMQKKAKADAYLAPLFDELP